MFSRVIVIHAICLSAILFSGCSQVSSGGSHPVIRARSSKTPIRIVTTTAMVTDLVRHVAGKHATVSGLIGTGVDPHLFKATRHDIKQLYDAEIVFYSGLMLEGRMQDMLMQMNTAIHPVIAVTEQLDESFLRSPPEFKGHFDPHVWMDVDAWSLCADVVVKRLSELDPVHADDFRQNAKDHQAELSKLHEYVKQVIASIPTSQRVLVTAHDAFGYFGRTYGIDVRSVQGVTTESEAGVQDVNRLVDFLVERKLPAIFVESSVNQKNIQAVIEGAQSRHVAVRVGAELFSDAMGSEGTYEGTYIGMLDHNATLISRALGGTAPEAGYQGRLALKQDAP